MLQALQEHDEVLAEVIAKLRESRDITSGFNEPAFREKIEILPPDIPLNILRQSITTKLLDGLISVRPSWESMFQALTKFKQHHGHCNVEWHHDYHLTCWTNRHRAEYTSGRLSEKQVRRLNDIGFDWEWDSSKHEWETAFQVLVQYKQRFGHCNVPKEFPENQGLRHWVEDQRSSCRNNNLSEERIRRLSEIGFVWDLEWDPMFQELVQFKQQHGHCNVPEEWPENPDLGWWVGRTRDICGNRDRLWIGIGGLSKYQIQRLNEIGFICDFADLEWDPMFQALTQYKKRFRHCNVPLEWPENPHLGWWVQRQRELRGNHRYRDRLNVDQMRRLNEIGLDDVVRATYKKIVQRAPLSNPEALEWKPRASAYKV